MRLITWVVLSLALAGCSLTGEPRFTRPLPSSADGSTGSDGAMSVDGSEPDAVVADGADAAAPDGAQDGGPSCVPIGQEICNGIDDDCDEITDNVPIVSGVTCVVNVPRGAAMVPTLGELRGCECVVTPRPAEICGNAVDDNNDGVADEGCECDAYVVPSELVRSAVAPHAALIRIFGSVEAALTGTATLMRHRNICLFTGLLSDCRAAPSFFTSSTIPDNVSLLGGWVVSGLAIQRSAAPECRTPISGSVTFAPGSGANTVLSRVRVRREGDGAAVSMQDNGWIAESTIEAFSIDGPATGINADGAGTQRMIRAVSVTAESSGGRAAGIDVARGMVEVTGASLRINGGREGVGVHVEQTRFARVSDVDIVSITGSELVNGVHVDKPAGPAVLVEVRGGASGGIQTARGFFADCDSRVAVQIVGGGWRGAAGIETDGVLVRGCRAEIRLGARPTSFVAHNASNDIGATRADALRCESSASCEVLGTPQRAISFQAVGLPAPALVDQSRGVAITAGARGIIVGAVIDGRGGSVSSVGLEMGGSQLVASLNEIIAGGATGPEASRAVEIDQSMGVLLQTNALRVHQGVGLAIMADNSTAVAAVSNTISSISSASATNVNLVVINASRRTPNVSFENNLLACSNTAAAPLAMLRGVVVGSVNPFALFSYNMIAGCVVPAVMGASNMSDPMSIQSAFDPMHGAMGALQVPRGSAGVDAMSGWRISASSAAQGLGSPNVRESIDMDGQRRSTAPMPDIGADEI